MKLIVIQLLCLLLTGCLPGVKVAQKSIDNPEDNNSTTEIDTSVARETGVYVDYGESNATGNEEVKDTQSTAQENQESNDLAAPSIEEVEEASTSDNTVVQNDELCGTIYRDKNNDFHLSSSSNFYQLNLDDRVDYSLNTHLVFPNDAAKVCIIYENLRRFKALTPTLPHQQLNLMVHQVDVISLSSSLEITEEHPLRKSKQSKYDYEFCGVISLQENANIELDIYKIESSDGKTYDLMFPSNSDMDQIEYIPYEVGGVGFLSEPETGNFCIYTNSSPSTEYNWTYRKFIKVEESDGLGNKQSYILFTSSFSWDLYFSLIEDSLLRRP